MENVNGSKQKKPWYKRVWVWILVVIIVAAIGSSASPEPSSAPTAASETSTASTESKMPETPTEQPPAAEEPAPAPIAVSAKDLIAAYEKNEVSADSQYKDQVLSVTGVVSDIGVVLDQTSVCIDSGADFEFVAVRCYFSDENEIAEKVSTLSTGDTVTITGICKGQSLDVELDDCTISS